MLPAAPITHSPTAPTGSQPTLLLNHPDGVVQGCPGGAALGTGSILCLTPAHGCAAPCPVSPQSHFGAPPPSQHPLLAVPEPGTRRFY